VAELRLLTDMEQRSPVNDWAVRGGVAVFFIVFGMEKFSSDPGSHWVQLFAQIGAGLWFRYLTGVLELLGGLLVLIPKTALIGLATLACTMAGAVVILAFVVGEPGSSLFPGIFLLALIAIGLVRWGR
jgi:putative oxidoreductase